MMKVYSLLFLFVFSDCVAQSQFSVAQELQSILPIDFALLDVVDFNADNRADHLVIDEDGDMKLYFLEEDGSYEESLVYSFDTYPAGTRDVHLTDYDLNGTLDILVSKLLPEEVFWFSNNGLGGFEAPVTLIETPEEGAYTAELITTDVNDDGNPDLLYLTKIRLYGGSVIGPFAHVIYGPSSAMNEPVALEGAPIEDLRYFCICDLDGNDTADLVGAPQGVTHSYHWFPNFPEPFPSNELVLGLTALAVLRCADIDSDGDQDLLVSMDTSQQQFDKSDVWIKNENDGTFTKEVSESPHNVYDLQLVDINGDDRLDMLFSEYEGTIEYGIYWRPLLSNNTFGPSRLITDDLFYRDPFKAIDHDNDGDLDVVVHFDPLSSIRLYENMPALPQPDFAKNDNDCNWSYFLNLTECYFPDTSFEWDFGNGQTSNEVEPDFSSFESGTYNVTLTACNGLGCASTTKEIVVEYGAQMLLPESAVVGETISFGVSPSAHSNFTWLFGDGEVSTDESPTYSYSEPGTYLVECIATDPSTFDCTRVIQQEIAISAANGIDEALPVIDVYPNPVSHRVYIRANEHTSIRSVKLFDLTGKELLSERSKGGLQVLSLEGITPGVYYLQLVGEDGFLVVRKIVRL